jgi:hypothetical protein
MANPKVKRKRVNTPHLLDTPRDSSGLESIATQDAQDATNLTRKIDNEVHGSDAESAPPLRKRPKPSQAGDYETGERVAWNIPVLINRSLPPMHELADIFDHMAQDAIKNDFEMVTRYLGNKKLCIATMCSGTESPLLALTMLSEGIT